MLAYIRIAATYTSAKIATNLISQYAFMLLLLQPLCEHFLKKDICLFQTKKSRVPCIEVFTFIFLSMAYSRMLCRGPHPTQPYFNPYRGRRRIAADKPPILE